jgi:Family of unknown function (DUF6452)
MKKIILLLLVAFSFSACEKDDICDTNLTATTPKLVVEFYDIVNPTAKKSFENLAVIAENITDTIKPANGSKVLLPLKIDAETVTFKFIQNGGKNPKTDDNIDKITINYTKINTYVSRACGFKTTFELNPTNGIVLIDTAPSDNLWMRETQIRINKIENENEIHVKILF